MKEMKTTNKKGLVWGFAVPGMLLNVTVGGLLVVGTGTLGFSSMRKVGTMASYPSLNNLSQTASSLIAQDIRRASSVDRATDEEIVLSVHSAQGTCTVTYSYDTAGRTLTRIEGPVTQTILKDVDSLSFSLFQRPAANAAFDTLAPATAPTARVVGCHWTCSRRVAGAKLDKETVQMAPVVLRNHC